MPHPPHLAARVTCLTCHATVVGEKKATDGHAQCGTCHKTGARLTLEACLVCHVSPSEAKGRTAEVHPWSVAARFKHDSNHRSNCEGCHRKEGEADLTRPTMGGCGRCHDGKQAFKVTGFGCVRCHGGKS
jgi:hypothetical protein